MSQKEIVTPQLAIPKSTHAISICKGNTKWEGIDGLSRYMIKLSGVSSTSFKKISGAVERHQWGL